MSTLAAYARASHAAPTAAVTGIVTACAWSLGWRGPALLGVLVTVLIGQLSVGWSNDAVDAGLDATSERAEKPTVAGQVTAAALWRAALLALVASVAASWWVAGWVGGSFHVLSLAMAWLYNLVLSRTGWSWLPYAVAFAAIPPFLTFGLDGSAPSAWMVVVFAIVGVSAHLANALPDLEADTAAGLDGAVIRLGAARAASLAWLLLALGSAVLAVVTAREAWALTVLVVAGFAVAWAYAHRSSSRTAMFHGLLAAVALDVVALVLASS